MENRAAVQNVDRSRMLIYEELRFTELHGVNQDPEKVKHGGSFEVREIIVAVGATLAVISLAIAIAIIVVRRRRAYKRGASGSALSEDSDVRFLTSDEILDFNLARPTDNDEL